MSRRVLHILYWVSTILFVVPEAWNAFLMLMEAPRMAETMTGLGYPIYFMKILGGAKLMGVSAIIALNRYPHIKDWAYAGFAFELVGASLSHMAAGDIVLLASIPLLFLLLEAASYITWRAMMRELPAESRASTLPPVERDAIGRWPYSARASIRLRGHT